MARAGSAARCSPWNITAGRVHSPLMLPRAAFPWTRHRAARALRAPGLWVAAGLGATAVVVDFGLDLLAFDHPGQRGWSLAVSTATVVFIAWCLWDPELQDEQADRSVLEASALGDAGRWAGALAARSAWAGALAAMCLLLATVFCKQMGESDAPSVHGLACVALAAFPVVGWAHAVAAWRPGPTGAVVALAAWVAGHALPPHGVAALLPAPAAPSLDAAAAARGVLVTAGTLLVAAAGRLRRRA